MAFHINKGLVRKYMNSLLIGELSPEQPSFEPTKNKELTDEFRELRATVEQMGLMKANHVFFLLYLLHILLLDVAAWLTLWVFGTSYVPFILCAVLLSTVQVRALGLSRAQLLSASPGKALCTLQGAKVPLPSDRGRAEDV